MRSAANLNVVHGTLSGNTTTTGGGVYVENSSNLTLTNALVSGNSASGSGSELFNVDYSTTITSVGANLLGSGSIDNMQAFVNFTPGMADIVATSDGGQPTALTGILSPLADNGGDTLTHALFEGGPADNTADNAHCLATDQRGVARADDQCDIGAYEISAKDRTMLIVIPLNNGKTVVVPL